MQLLDMLPRRLDAACHRLSRCYTMGVSGVNRELGRKGRDIRKALSSRNF